MDRPWRFLTATFVIIGLCHTSTIHAQDSSPTFLTSSTDTTTPWPSTTNPPPKLTNPPPTTNSPETPPETTLYTSSTTTISTMPVTSPSTSEVTQSMILAGDNCTAASKCVKGAVCNNSVCTCTDDFYATYDGRCHYRLKVLESCEETKQCVVNAECRSKICLCTADFFRLNGLCVHRIPIGGSCSTGENNGCVENAFCSSLSNTCHCIESEYYTNGTVCVQKPSYGENCTKDTGCLVLNSECNVTFNTCICTNGYYYAGSMCKTVSKLKPQTVRVTKRESKSLTISWTAPEGCNKSLCYYNVRYKNGGRQELNTSDLSIEVTSLQPGRTYTIRVQTVYNDIVGNTKNSGKVNITDSTMETQAENLRISGITYNSLIVSFDEPENETRDYFKLNIRDKDNGTTWCVSLYRHISTDDLCGNGNKCQKKESISSNDKNITYKVTDLRPFTNYTITVVMVTCTKGNPTESDPANETVRTEPAVPGPVLNLRVTHNNTYVCSTWSPPEPYPGPVNYTVSLVDNVTNSVTVERRIPENHTCLTQSDLSAFWEYKFNVTAFTSAGFGASNISETIITNRSDPVVNFKVVNADGGCCRSSGCGHPRPNGYRRFLIKWMDPEPRKRGTRLTRYVITVRNITHGGVHNVTEKVSSELTEADDRTYRRTPSVEHTVSINVTPGGEYSFKFWTFDNNDVVVNETEMNCKAPIGKPPSWASSPRKPTLVDSSDKTLTIQFSHPVFYKNVINGQITESGMIISRNYMRVSDTDVRSIKMDPWGPQKVMYRIGKPGSTIKSQGDLITIGADGDCSDFPSGEQYYCNGELQPETKYYLLVFVCSERGCVQSPMLGPYHTSPVDRTVTIVAALIGVALLLGVAVVIGALLWKYKRSDHLPLQLSLRPRIDLSKIPRERPVQLSNMAAHVADLHADSNRLFSMQYEDIIRISPKHPTNAANMDENKQKNRWVNVLPFDDSRVRMSVIDEDATSDYINASYLPGYNWDQEYIASQGPLPGTVDDFWRMIWEKNVSMIVMVTPIKENGKVKCEEYWPVEEPKQYGNIVVENISFSSLNTYNVTIFKIRNGDENDFRTVKHFHFLNWKDMSANVERTDVLDFVRTVRSYLRPDMEGPMVVHCSAGVGRTGTFILLDYLIQFIDNHDFSETVDIYGFILRLRENRVLMVQTESQYVFIHDCASQLVDEKRQAMDNISENELLYVNTEIGTQQSEDEEDGNAIYENTENASTSRLIQQTEL